MASLADGPAAGLSHFFPVASPQHLAGVASWHYHGSWANSPILARVSNQPPDRGPRLGSSRTDSPARATWRETGLTSESGTHTPRVAISRRVPGSLLRLNEVSRDRAHSHE